MQTPNCISQGETLQYDCIFQGHNNLEKEFNFFFQDIRFNQIRALLDYMYHGEVDLPQIKYQKPDH